MDIESIQKPDQNMDRTNQLRQLLLQLTTGVKITETDPDLREIQDLQRQKLLEDIGVLLVVAAHNQTIGNLWDLLEPHVSAEKLSGQEFDRYQEQLSKPLTGQPSEVLKMAGFSQQGHLFKEILDNLRQTMIPQQQQLLPQVIGRLV